ncbi:heme ABC transporter ATP-binding protein [Gleimia hominis]|uniref:Heme ABC transporter ATP-binding protein n=1 Tax=Gleimia hominis TaxID=595468 RepID=A0ABU3ICA6_9ACTO|nr:heme ABC transporter ATP-binding protein [Gleimia hominis]MDT3767986.1 heme ABC transporter ATP-binding protein [Gleimia hominis]
MKTVGNVGRPVEVETVGNVGSPVEMEMVGNKKIVEANNVSFSYGSNQVLDSVDFYAHEGELIGLLGPNGTGKTTLLKTLCGDLPLQRGRVLLRGREVSDYAPKELARTRAVMPQTSAFPFAFLVQDIVQMGCTPWGVTKEEVRVVVQDALRTAGVEHLKDREVTQLSGGETARVTFARVLAQRANLIFLDEPTAALDVAHQERLMANCCELVEEGRTVIAVMHDIQLAAAYCTKIALMKDGRIAAFGEPKDVLTARALEEAYGWPIRVEQLPGGELVFLPKKQRLPKKGAST